ncbi:MAG: oligosaccharide flippase family protein, partial [Candidatus Bathyarchaeia archaeon]
MTNELAEVVEGSTRGGLFIFLGTITSTAILAITSIIIARFLGPEFYGQYSLSVFLSQFLFLFSDFGMNQGLIKFATDLRMKGDLKTLRKIVQFSIVLRIFIGAAVSLVVFYLATYFSLIIGRSDISSYIQLSSLMIVFQAIHSIIVSAFIGLDKAEYNALANIILSLTRFVASVYLILSGFKIVGAIMGNFIGYAAASVMGALILFSKCGLIGSHLKSGSAFNSSGNIKDLVRFSMPLYTSILLTGFLPLCQNIMLAIFTSDVEIGNFKAATNFTTAISIIFASVTLICLQAFSKINSLRKEDKVADLFAMISKYTCLLVAPIVTLIFVFSKETITILYGPLYQSAHIHLSLLCASYLLIPLGYLTLSSLFNGFGETNITLKLTVINFLLFTLLGLPLTILCGTVGMIIAFFSSNVISTFFARLFAEKKFKIKLKITAPLMGTYLVAAFSSAPLLLFHPIFSSSILRIFAGISVYFLVYLTLI